MLSSGDRAPRASGVNNASKTRPRPERVAARYPGVRVHLLAGGLIAILGAGSPPTPAATALAAASAPATRDTVRYTFDGRLPLADVTGHGHDLSPVSRHGGSYATVAHGDGAALAFPPPCHTEPCPRIALRAADSPDLDPGRRPIRYGGSVRLDADETSKGENVLQKGYSASGSQYKLQVDGAGGHPSCVLVDDRRPRIHLAYSDVGVADGHWHTIECRRAGSSLTILVDGSRTGSAVIPADLSVDNHIPLSVGGKGSFTNNDQFQGTLDDIWVAID
jgi:hypothetical protein